MMIFCGQCGLQLAPGSTRCPRCGATVDATASAPFEEVHIDDATVASSAFQVRNPPVPTNPGKSPQPLILRPSTDNSTFDFGAGAADATSHIDTTQNYGKRTPSNQNMGASYTGYQQSGGAYSTQGAYPEYSSPNAGNYPQQGMPYAGGMQSQMGTGYVQQPGQYQTASPAASNKGGRIAAMIIILFGLLFVLGAVALFIIQQTNG